MRVRYADREEQAKWTRVVGREEVLALCRGVMSSGGGTALNRTVFWKGCVAQGIRQLPGLGTLVLP